MRFFKDMQERYFIIGRVYEDEKLVGYKIYAAYKKKVLGLVTKEVASKELRDAKRAGQELIIVGLTVSESYTISEMRNCSYNINKLDKVNGKGHPIQVLGNYVLISFSGFSENRKYRLINSKGYERIVYQEEFEVLLDEGKVNGAMRPPRDKEKMHIYKHCNYRENGFEETSI